MTLALIATGAARPLGRSLLRLGLVSLTLLGGCTALVSAGVAGQPPAPTLRPSRLALSDIPASLLPRYTHGAQECLGLPWPVLAAVGKVVSDHGRRPSRPGNAQDGPTASPVRLARGGQGMDVMGLRPDDWQRYGGDANHEGTGDREDPAQAIPVAARLLCSLEPSRDLRAAIASYLCGDLSVACASVVGRYVEAVLQWSGAYVALPVPPLVADAGTDAVFTGVTGAIATNVTGNQGASQVEVQAQLSHVLQVTLSVAVAQLGTPYRWGGEEPGGFDCSGLLQYSYGAGGISLPRTAQLQLDAGPRLSLIAMRDPRQLLPGDLLFFGASAAHVTHTGMYVGLRDGAPTMIVAPHTGASVQFQTVQLSSSWLVGASRPIARYLARPSSAGTAAS